MGWLKKHLWNIGIASGSVLFLLICLALLPMTTVSAHEEILGAATPTTITVQATPTVDATVTALSKEQLTLQVEQLQKQNNWLFSNSAALIAAFSAIAVAVFGIIQWTGTVRQAKGKDLKDREEERRKEVAAQEKDLKAQAEERFKTAVIALGDEKEGVQIGGAILLRSFLNKDDKKSYEQYYIQIFDLAVAYLRLPRTYRGADQSRELGDAFPLTTLSQAFIVAFKESFPLARESMKERNADFNSQALDASDTQLDKANLNSADLEQAWMPGASLQEANLFEANLVGANLARANLVGANLMKVKLNQANLFSANLSGAKLNTAELNGTLLFGANLSQANLSEANFSNASFHGADLGETDLGGADLSHTDLTLTNFRKARLFGANLSDSSLNQADLSNADLRYAHLSKVFLADANLSGADLSFARHFDTATSLERADLRGVKGLTNEQKAACQAKGAIVDLDPTISASQLTIAPSSPSQSNDVQASPAPSAQEGTPPPAPHGNIAGSTQQELES